MFVRSLVPLSILLCFVLAAIASDAFDPGADRPAVTDTTLVEAAKLLDLEFTSRERAQMREMVDDQTDAWRLLRGVDLPNDLAPALIFDPTPPGCEPDPGPARPAVWSDPGEVLRPDDDDALGFLTIGELGVLLRSGHLTAVELAQTALDRLRTFGPRLECVVSLTEDIAAEQAARADAELAAGLDRGPLHGIPYGLKDLFAVKGTRTTWGAAPYRDQKIDGTATVAARLEEAGAVLVAKLSLGALAWGDVWYGGRTRNPWNLEKGSSGSSAGPAAAVAAGLVPFAMGTETWGSIVSPSDRCGVVGLRPSFGRVSRAGAMALSWSMDKVGPLARTAEDCAVVLDAVRGADPRDRTARDLPFPYDPGIDVARLRIGYLVDEFELEYEGRDLDLAALDVLREMGADLTPVTLPDLPANCLEFILNAEAAAAFDRLTRSGSDDEMVRQIDWAWPNVFRASRFLPAVEYIQANRVRALLMQRMAALMSQVDLYVCPATAGHNLLVTNLTGHPSVAVPAGFTEEGMPHGITFVGRLYGEAVMLAVAEAYQRAAGFAGRRPPGF